MTLPQNQNSISSALMPAEAVSVLPGLHGRQPVAPIRQEDLANRLRAVDDLQALVLERQVILEAQMEEVSAYMETIVDQTIQRNSAMDEVFLGLLWHIEEIRTYVYGVTDEVVVGQVGSSDEASAEDP
jgi:hypothetical protein